MQGFAKGCQADRDPTRLDQSQAQHRDCPDSRQITCAVRIVLYEPDDLIPYVLGDLSRSATTRLIVKPIRAVPIEAMDPETNGWFTHTKEFGDFRYFLVPNRLQNHLCPLTDSSDFAANHSLQLFLFLICRLSGIKHFTPPVSLYCQWGRNARNFILCT